MERLLTYRGVVLGFIYASGEVQSDVEEVDDLLVHLGSHLEPVVLIHLLYLLPELLSEAVGQGAHCQAIIPVEAEVDREVLELVEEEESDKVCCLGSVITSHCFVELFPQRRIKEHRKSSLKNIVFL